MRACGFFQRLTQRNRRAEVRRPIDVPGEALDAGRAKVAAALARLRIGAQRRIDRASISAEQWARLIRDYLERLPTGGSSSRAV